MSSVLVIVAASILLACGAPARPAPPAPAKATVSDRDLFAAIKAGDDAAVTRLLAADPRLANARDPNGRSALAASLFRMRAGKPEGFVRPQDNRVLASVLAARPQLDRFEAAAVGDVARVRTEIDKDAAYVRAVSPIGWTPLHFATYGGNTAAVKVLLDHGAAIDAVAANEFANTPLQVSLLTQQLEVVQLLVARGANVKFKQHGGFTPLHEAAFTGNRAIVTLLLDAGADPNAVADDGKRPLGVALAANHDEVARLLRARGAKD
jgi:uncharacterized protein